MYWGAFLNWGEAHTFDWMLYEPLFTVIQKAVRTAQVPYHAAFFCGEAVRSTYLTNFRFLAAPWVVASPDVLALAWLRLPQWIVLHVVLLYSIGFLGIVKWIHQLSLSAAASTFVMVVYLLNGFYSAKLGVGHVGDLGGYFLVPWVFWLWTKFLEADYASSRHKLLLALEWAALLAVVIAFGAFHVIQGILLATLCIFAFRHRQLPWLGLGFGAAFLVGAYLFLPVLFYSGYRESGRLISSGYGSFTNPITVLYSLYEALLNSYPVVVDASWWERTAYISWLGLGIIAAAIAYPTLRQTQVPNPLRARPFVWGMLILFVSILTSVLRMVWSLVQYVGQVPAPDQYPARMIIVVVLYLVLLAATDFDRLFEVIKAVRLQLAVKWAFLLGLFVLLLRNSWFWALNSTGSYWSGDANNQPIPSACPELLTISGDEAYKKTVNASYLFSLIMVLALVGLYLYLKRSDEFSASS